MDPKKRLQVLNQSNPSLRVSVAPARPLFVDTGKSGIYQVDRSPNARIQKPTKPKGNLSDALIGPGSGVMNIGHDFADLVPAIIGQTKAFTPQSFDHFSDTARQKSQSLVDIPFDRYNRLAQDKGFYDVKNRPVTDIGRKSQIGGEVAAYVPGTVKLAADVPKIIAGVKNIPKLVKNIPTTIRGIKGRLNKAKAVEGPAVELGTEDAAILSATTDPVQARSFIQKKMPHLTADEADELAKFTAGEDNADTVKQVADAIGSRAQAEEAVRFSAAGHNVKDVVKAGGPSAKAITRAADPNDADPLRTYFNAIAKSPNKREVKDLIEKIGLPVTGTAKNRLVKDLTKETDSDKVVERLAQEISAVENAPAPVANTAAEAANAIENAPVQNGTVATTIAPNGATVKTAEATAKAPEATTVGETVNKTADNADSVTEQVATFTNAKTGAKSVRTQDQLKSELADITAIKKDKRTVAQQERAKEIRAKLKNWDAESVAAPKQSVDDLFPGLSPDARALVQETMDKLDSAASAYQDASKARKVETAQRSQAGNAAFEAAGGGQAGFKAEMAAQRGKKTESGFEPITGHQAAKDEIINDLKANTSGMDWEKRNAYNAFQKMWGDIEGKPTPSDIKYIKGYYNSKEDGLGDVVEQMIKQAEEAQANGMTAREIAVQSAGVPRTLMTIADASALRQLVVALARHPVVTSKNYAKSFPHMFSGKKFDKAVSEMEQATDQNGTNYSEFMDTVMGLHLPNVAEKASEETMSSAQLLSKGSLSKIPGVGKVLSPTLGNVVDASNRGMSSAVAHTRFQLAKQFIDANGGVANTTKNFSQKELEQFGEVLNTITGRGGKKGGFTDRHATILSQTLFSGKLWASRLQMLNPFWYYRLDGPAQKEALQGAAAFAASAGAILTLADQIPGVEVGKNPTSADFAKIKIGNTRYDILGGFQQNIRVAAQIVTGTRTNSTNGETKDTTISSVLGGLVEGKANPVLGYAYKLMNTLDDPDSSNPLARIDEWGEPINAAKEAVNIALPLNITGIGDTAADVGSLAKGAAMSVPGFFGAGVQTYGDTKSKDKGKTVYEGEVKPEMVTDTNGKVILDEDGKPVKIKIPKDATDLEIKALKEDKMKTALADRYRKTLSGEDQALMKLSDEKLRQYVKDGDITQERFDKIKNYQKTAESQGKANNYTVPEGIKSSESTAFYKKYNSMSEKDQEAWLKQKPDETAKTIASKANELRPKGLSEYKPSNQLSKAYAEYEKDINNHPEYTDLDKRDKLKSFYIKAAKLNYNDHVQDIFKEGSSKDLKYFLSENAISREELQQAITLDNELFKSGLTGSLKFSKTFRNSYGFGVPSGPGGSGSGGGSGGGGDDTKRAYLSDLLVSSSVGGKAKESPQFSSRSRPIKLKSKVSSGGSGNAKKISIKL